MSSDRLYVSEYAVKRINELKDEKHQTQDSVLKFLLEKEKKEKEAETKTDVNILSILETITKELNTLKERQDMIFDLLQQIYADMNLPNVKDIKQSPQVNQFLDKYRFKPSEFED